MRKCGSDNIHSLTRKLLSELSIDSSLTPDVPTFHAFSFLKFPYGAFPNAASLFVLAGPFVADLGELVPPVKGEEHPAETCSDTPGCSRVDQVRLFYYIVLPLKEDEK